MTWIPRLWVMAITYGYLPGLEAESEVVREGGVLYRKPAPEHDQALQNAKRIEINQPFTYPYEPGSIEKAAFDYAMVARTQNLVLLKTFYTPAALAERNAKYGGIGDDRFMPNADFSKHFSIAIRPHILEPTFYHVEVRYYLSERQPVFTTVAVMHQVKGEWKVK